MYVVDRKNEKCLLTIQTPEGKWPIVTGLDEVKDKKATFTAKTYDVLADNPVSMGAFLLDTYTYGGKTHCIAYRGAAKDQVDRERVKKACATISETECKFWGVQPYHKYVWHFSVREGLDGGGGLEHLASTQISMASGVGPGVVRVYAHEFFHLWNVKRVRSKVLGPFDYTQLPKTGALWFLEGVTDYYSNVLLARANWDSEQDFYRDLMNNLNGVRANPSRMEVSPYDASFRVGEAANGRGNSNGYKISYYNTGWLCGLVLDMEIREKSGGKHSLDDVERALWEICKDDKPGFEEDEIRKQCIRFGGPTLGPFYDKVIKTPGELPVEDALAKAGLEIAEIDEPTVELGFGWVPDRDKGGPRIRRVDDSVKTVLSEGDIVVELGGKPVGGTGVGRISFAMNDAVRLVKAGEPLKLKISRDGVVSEVTINPTAGTRKAKRVIPQKAPSPDALARKKAWLTGIPR
jgi:predicted metalloprotease with PDZ domain